MRPGDPNRLPGGAAARVRPEITAAVRLSALLGVLGAFGPLALFSIIGSIFQLVLPTSSMRTLWGLVAGFVVIAAVLVLIDHLRDVTLIRISHRVGRRLAAPALLAVAGRPGGNPAQASHAVLRDIEEIRRGVAGPLCTVALDLVLAPVILLTLGFFHIGFLVFGAVVALAALALGILANRLTRDALAQSNGDAVLGSMLVLDAVRCAEAVESMGMLPGLVRRWAATLARGMTQLRSAQATARAVSAVTITLYALVASGTMVLGVVLILQGAEIGYGMMVAALLTGRLMAPFGQIGAVLEDAASARAAWGRIDTLLREADHVTGPALRAWPCNEGRLSVERVTYLHPGANRPLLREASFTVSPGEVVALAGPPGAGKSTLMRLILGIERPTAGNILLDGHTTALWDREDLARHVGFLAQDPALSGGTVAEAIARLQREPDMAEVVKAARLVGAERMIAGLPRGFSTPVAGDVRLSMGQRQRIALARAVYGAPRLVLLDEPAAYLDGEGEAAVLRLLTTLGRSGVAVIFTSHREALMRCASRVLHLQERPASVATAASRLPPRIAAPLKQIAAGQGAA
jgi:ATP-binding cassette subfamily C protein